MRQILRRSPQEDSSESRGPICIRVGFAPQNDPLKDGFRHFVRTNSFAIGIFFFVFFLSMDFVSGQESAPNDTARKNISSPLPAVTATKTSSSEKRQTFTSPEPESKVEKEKSKQEGRGQFNSSKPMNIVIPKETKDKDKK